jgi:hypothetical protein
MRRLFNVFVCSLVVYAVCGCASSDNGRISQESPVPSRAETKASSQNPSTANVCTLDPVAAALEISSPAPSTGDGPVVEIPESTYVFGASVRSNFTHTFIVKNVGTSDLKIRKVLPG